MNAEAIVQLAHELSITLSLAGDRIRYAPKSATPPNLVEMLRQHKAELIEYLRQENRTGPVGVYRQVYLGDSGPNDEELRETVRRVQEEGYVLLRSTVLNDFVAFYKTEADRKKIPPDFVPYSERELWELFGEGKTAPSPGTLKLIHEAKKHGGRIISPESDPGEEAR